MKYFNILFIVTGTIFFSTFAIANPCKTSFEENKSTQENSSPSIRWWNGKDAIHLKHYASQFKPGILVRLPDGRDAVIVRNNGIGTVDVSYRDPNTGDMQIEQEYYVTALRSPDNSSINKLSLKTPNSLKNREPPKVRTDIYNQNYVLPSNEILQIAKKHFKEASRKHVRDFLQQDGTINPADNTYMLMGSWKEHFSTRYKINDFPLQGWKFHISAKPENMYQIVEKILPILQKEKIFHKILRADKFNQYIRNIGTIDYQQGKFITVYPANKEEIKKYAQILKETIEENKFSKDDFINIPNEIEITPGVFARYGRLRGGDVELDNGEILKDDMILTPLGKQIKDPRGKWIPDFIKVELKNLLLD